MCRSWLPLFGNLDFQRCYRDEIERFLRQSRAFRQEEMGSEVIMILGFEVVVGHELIRHNSRKPS